MKDLGHYRKSYEKSALTEDSIPENPIQLFKTWFDEMDSLSLNDEVNVMTISTIGLDGFPKSRIVLLKKFTEEGFMFFTNYRSEKGRAIAANPNVCLSFFWGALERQVIIKGVAEKTSADVSDAYFESRPLGSRLGAVVSDQSQIIPSREWLDSKLKDLETGLAGDSVQRPEHWGGYFVRPVEIEFWQGRLNRLHDRINYKNEKGRWTFHRLAP